MVPAARELTDRQSILVEAVLSGTAIPEAGRLAGYVGGTSVYAALRSPLVQSALAEGREHRLRSELSVKALATMEALLDAPTPAATRFSAAKWVLESAGHGGKDADEGKDKPLHEMNEAELRRFMARAQRVVDEGGPAPLIHVVPDNGALPALPDPRDG